MTLGAGRSSFASLEHFSSPLDTVLARGLTLISGLAFPRLLPFAFASPFCFCISLFSSMKSSSSVSLVEFFFFVGSLFVSFPFDPGLPLGVSLVSLPLSTLDLSDFNSSFTLLYCCCRSCSSSFNCLHCVCTMSSAFCTMSRLGVVGDRFQYCWWNRLFLHKFVCFF